MAIINNALSGALAAQVALTTSSDNIANLQTKGYTRQAALLAAIGRDAHPRSPGNGVQVTSLLRFSDNYKSQAMWRAAAELGAYSQTQPYLSQLENVMGDETASLSAGIDQFFGALNAVAGDPGSTPLRQQVLTSAGLMAERFNGLNNVFNAQLQSVRNQRSAIVDSANAQIATIARLNQQISAAQAGGVSSSSLIDARDQAIDELASKMALEVSDNGDGTRDISLKTGQALVLGSMHGSLKAAPTATSSQEFSLSFAGTTYVLDAGKLGGQLGGLAKYETEKLVPLQTGIADMANQIAAKVNAQLALGYKADGVAGPPLTASPGERLFVYTPGSGADMLKVIGSVEAADLAFSADGNPGDTGNLQQLVAIKSASISVTSIGTVLLSDADAQLVGKLGVDSQLNKAALKTTPQEIATRLDRTLSPVQVRVGLDKQQLVFSAPESAWSGIKDAIAISGRGRVDVAEDPSGLAPEQWDVGNPDALRQSLREVVQALARVRRSQEAASAALSAAMARVEQPAIPEAELTSISGDFAATAASHDYQSLLAITSALVGVSRERVQALLGLR